MPAIGLWAQVPHYVSAMPYPAATLALLEGANRVAGLELPLGDLPDRPTQAASASTSSSPRTPSTWPCSSSSRRRPKQAAEHRVQATTGDELAAELERFLREQG